MYTGIIRQSKKTDCPAIYRLICEMEEKQLPYANFKQIYYAQHESPNYVCLVYSDDEFINGCINLRIEYQLHHAEQICEIMEFSVSAKHRNSGIGKILFEAACTWAKEKRCSQIEVCCNQLRNRTHHFYEARGMHNFHYKFSLNFTDTNGENQLGR